MNDKASIAISSRSLQIAFSLVLGSVTITFAQMNNDLPKGIQLASVNYRLNDAFASRYVSTGDFTNQHVALRSVSAPKGDPDPGLCYSMPPSQPRSEAELNQTSLNSSLRLAGPAPTASPQGWRTGGGGVVNYTARNQRWRLVFGYAPDLSVLRGDFYHLHSFSLVWQHSVGKLKPASWTGAPAGYEHERPPAAFWTSDRPDSF